ncbi:YdaS family helix-turn-helix protein [Chitiniphilus purpureus]|uniref:YdaS family helix-turn-helix protein n=1 Tax=Chitiniphilus purpureus TaxID=2981137 RepID=UPI0027E4F7C9|nr:YdaS family helix-turn-helix protein [Chitiniphilus sp. CD1]
MDLKTYLLAAKGRGAALAAALGVNQVLISTWAHGKRPVPAGRCPAIERATDGQVRCEELRPDIDWAYLRGTGKG